MLGTVEQAVQLGARAIASLAEFAAALIIAAAIVQALWRSLYALFLPRNAAANDEAKQNLRLQLGRWLAIALEFLLAADILLTAIAPTWEDIGKLGAIALIRTALNYFLEREIDANNREKGKMKVNGDA
ncbi:DUF1622 domain-containing protein [Deinococcus sp. AJ005]|uniref:DUF1622 domain-containing protein n=1 Tax=Deinococcus sp. AJ005 TaxID=2652443 RepID=UPI001CF70930|nr:DUF1622 domain-containing protein [Deinococcus sp. AJ005]